MGIKKFFKIKPPEEDTVDQNRDNLLELGISVKNVNKKKRNKFAAYGQFAKDSHEDKVLAPPGYENFKPDDPNDLNKAEIDEEVSEQEEPKKSGLFRRKHKKDKSTDKKDKPYETDSTADPYGLGSTGKWGAQSTDEYDNFNSSYGNYGNYGDYTDKYANNSNNTFSAYNENHFPEKQSSSVRAKAMNSNTYQQNTLDDLNAVPYDNDSPTSNLPTSELQKSNKPSRYNSYTNSGTRSPETKQNSYSEISKKSSSKNATSAPGSNPYASLANDSYATNLPANQYSASAQGYPSRSRRSNIDIDRSGSTVAGTGSKSGYEHDDLNETIPMKPTGSDNTGQEFEFEEPYSSAIANKVAVQEDYTLNDTGQDRFESGGLNDDFDDLNATMYDRPRPQMQQAWQMEDEIQQQTEFQPYDYTEDLNQTIENQQGERGYKTFEEVQREEEERQQQEEDEAVDEIKQEIRFTKQSSVASTRNTLKMAQEAEMSGMNSLGVLGHQSEQLYNVERNLDLMKVQNQVADEKVSELKSLNRSLLAIRMSNPFNSKSRRREREEQLKNRKLEEKLMMEHTSNQIASSTQRIEGALVHNGTSEMGVRERYQRQAVLDRAKKYQFENDEEDDELELEIDRNLDKIQQISGRLKRLAVTAGEELDSQQVRLKNIEENTDETDIKIHMNTTKLAGIR